MHLTTTAFKQIIQVLAIGFLLSACGGSGGTPKTDSETNTTQQEDSEKALIAIGSREPNITIEQLKAISGLEKIVDKNIEAYRAYIIDPTNAFSPTATQFQVQIMITLVNASQTVLTNIGVNDDRDESNVSIANLNAILPALHSVMNNVAHLLAYQAYIRTPANIFSNPATRDEVQDMINTVNARFRPLPENMTIDASNLTSSIASIYDDTPHNPAVDLQGVIDMNLTTKGKLVKIPYTVLNEAVTLPAYSSTFSIESTSTEDNESGIVATFYWDETNLSVGSDSFDAYIRIDDSNGSNDGIYRAKKLDIEDNASGFTAASFTYLTSNGFQKDTLRLQVIPGIPDRMYGIADNNGSTESHKFLYQPVTNDVTGRTWLNNNLGAEYANTNSAYFNPAQQAIRSNDHRAFGSLFQWGRKADGHELISWSSKPSIRGTAVHGNAVINIRSNTPTDALFIRSASGNDWRSNQNNTLWASEASPNNVCPQGYRLPLNPNGEDDASNEFYVESQTWGADNQNTSGAFASTLVLPASGYHHEDGRVIYSVDDIDVRYWSGSVDGTFAHHMDLNPTNVLTNSSYYRSLGHSVRCIKDQNATEISDTILAAIGTDDDASRSDITITELNSIFPELEDINESNEKAYQDYIANPANTFMSPATRNEVANMITAVNAAEISKIVLAAIGEDDDANASDITIAELKRIDPPLTDINESKEEEYRTYIGDSNKSFQSPATRAEVENMINAINMSQAVLTTIGSTDRNDSNVTFADLSSIYPPLSFLNANNAEAYGDYIRDLANNFSSPATIDEVQVMVTTVNDIQAPQDTDRVLMEIGEDHNNGSSNVTFDDLSNIHPPLDVIRTNERAYQDYIANPASQFSNPALHSEVENMINRVNSNVVLEEIRLDHGNNASDVTFAELKRIIDAMDAPLQNVYEAYIEAYQEYIADPTYPVATLEQVQDIINTANMGPTPLPKNMTINDSSLSSLIASLYSLEANSIVNIQGKIDMNLTPEGMLVIVPYTVTNESITLPAYSSDIFEIESSNTVNNESGIEATFSWPETNLSVGSGTFNAYIRIDDSNGNNDNVYNAKKLDLEDNAPGFTAASFVYPTTSGAGTGTLSLQVAPGIRDRMYGIEDNDRNSSSHKFVYLPVTNPTTGRTWLNNNLGAAYANTNSPDFNLTQQAQSSIDHRAYGSLFQWGRKADGHELISWSSATSGTRTGTTTTLYNDNNNLTHALFIKGGNSDELDWRVNSDETLWASEASPNNPCPQGYRLPLNPNGDNSSSNEFYVESQTWMSSNPRGATLKFPSPVSRLNNGSFDTTKKTGRYWSGSVGMGTNTNKSTSMILTSTTVNPNGASERANGQSVRCIKD